MLTTCAPPPPKHEQYFGAVMTAFPSIQAPGIVVTTASGIAIATVVVAVAFLPMTG